MTDDSHGCRGAKDSVEIQGDIALCIKASVSKGSRRFSCCYH